jgi:hypothetical protein
MCTSPASISVFLLVRLDSDDDNQDEQNESKGIKKINSTTSLTAPPMDVIVINTDVEEDTPIIQPKKKKKVTVEDLTDDEVSAHMYLVILCTIL